MTRVRNLLLAAGLLAAVGCQNEVPKTAVVNGKVTLQGRPVPNGTVNFIPANGPSATGEIRPDGTFTLTTYKPGDGAVLGKHKVVVVAMEDNANKLPEQRSPTPATIVPNKYTSPATSPLTAEVENRVNDVLIELEKSEK